VSRIYWDTNLFIYLHEGHPAFGPLVRRIYEGHIARNETLENKNQFLIPAGSYISLTFTDQGSGIPDEDLTRIFDPYFSTKPKGTGLGLASVYSIVSRHRGHISVSSTVGTGTTFTILLPSTGREYLPAQADSVTQTSSDQPSRSILVMDDEDLILKLTTGMLEYLGHRVTTCENGSEAIAHYRKAMESGSTYSTVIMDLTIPGGMGGKAAAEQILAMDPEACLIVSSGYSNDPVMSDYRSYGFAGSVAKPYKVSELSQVLRSVLNEKRKA